MKKVTFSLNIPVDIFVWQHYFPSKLDGQVMLLYHEYKRSHSEWKKWKNNQNPALLLVWQEQTTRDKKPVIVKVKIGFMWFQTEIRADCNSHKGWDCRAVIRWFHIWGFKVYTAFKTFDFIITSTLSLSSHTICCCFAWGANLET